jgi:hypothetical protein
MQMVFELSFSFTKKTLHTHYQDEMRKLFTSITNLYFVTPCRYRHIFSKTLLPDYQTTRCSNQNCDMNTLLISYNLFWIIDDHRSFTCGHENQRTVDHRLGIREVNYCGVIDMRVVSHMQ